MLLLQWPSLTITQPLIQLVPFNSSHAAQLTPCCLCCHTSDNQQNMWLCQGWPRGLTLRLIPDWDSRVQDETEELSIRPRQYWDQYPWFWDQDLWFWDQDPGFWDQDPGFWDQDPWFWDQDPGFWDQDPWFWDQDPWFWDQDPGFWDQDPWFWDQDPWFSDQDPSFWDQFSQDQDVHMFANFTTSSRMSAAAIMNELNWRQRYSASQYIFYVSSLF